ncbi:unnamed protein product [Oikopleura dioica]|uniref:FAD dependent oxidoreductase domain-containing protein n=1 Tax=Oikopleura dioica TaxID=34765 RepID=E4XYC7_OIKDI|nr:unnamed protein product [Oikopleura dioica]
MEPNSNSKLPIIVVGAGAVGVATALALRRRGEEVLLLEQFFIGHQRGSSHGPSRIIRYLYEKERYTQMMPNAYKLWAQLESEQNVKLNTKCGILNISSASRKQIYTEILSKNNFKFTDKIDDLPVKESEEFGYVLEEEGGVLDANLCVRASFEQFLKLGGKFMDGFKLKDFEDDGTIVTVNSEDGKSVQGRKLVLACGAWAKKILAKTGVEIPLEVIKTETSYWRVKPEFTAGIIDVNNQETGDIYHYYWTPVKEYQNLIKISYHGTYRDEVDPDERDDPEKDSKDRAAKQLEDHQRVIEMHFEGIDSSNPVIVEPCMYTVSKNGIDSLKNYFKNTPDNDFVLDAHPKMKNVFIGAGFSGHGFKMSPETGEILANLALGEENSYDMSFFSLKRFEKSV